MEREEGLLYQQTWFQGSLLCRQTVVGTQKFPLFALLLISVSYLTEKGVFKLISIYFDNFKYFGNQYLTENLDKVESSLQKSRISRRV